MQHRIDPDHAFRLDTAVMKHTAFLSFADLLAASFNTPYRPTLRRDLMGADADMIANAYDAELDRAGDLRRAYRGRPTCRTASQKAGGIDHKALLLLIFAYTSAATGAMMMAAE